MFISMSAAEARRDKPVKHQIHGYWVMKHMYRTLFSTCILVFRHIENHFPHCRHTVDIIIILAVLRNAHEMV